MKLTTKIALLIPLLFFECSSFGYQLPDYEKDLKLIATFELLPPEKQKISTFFPMKNEKTGAQHVLLP